MQHGALEAAVVIGAGRGEHLILRCLGGDGLENFLQRAFRIVRLGRVVHIRERWLEGAQNKIPRDFVAAIQEQRAQHGLEGIGQDRRPLAPAVELLAAAEDQQRPETQRAALRGERILSHELRADFRKRAFVVVRITGEERVREDELQHGVPEIFEALVVILARAQLVGNGRMRQRQPQQVTVAKRVAEVGLQGIQAAHGARQALEFSSGVPAKAATGGCSGGTT